MNPIDNKDFQEKFSYALEGIALDFQESLKEKLTKEHGKDIGSLQSGIRATVQGNEIIISMPEHALYLEYGTTPHSAPVDALEGWAMRKLGDKDKKWALWWHIKKFGTRPFPFIRNTFEYETVDIVRKNFKIAFK